MDREEAQRVVDGMTFRTDKNFAAVTHSGARLLLGDERFDLMMNDKIKCKGPTADTVYPWNVVDYMTIGLRA